MFQKKKNCRENQNTHLMSSNFSFFENRVVHDIMWKNVERGRPQMTIWCMRVACWIPKATDTHSEYVILIAFALQQYSHEPPGCYVVRTLLSCVRSSEFLNMLTLRMMP